MPKRLPRLDELIVEPSKLTDYLLCASHPDGAPKAKFFAGMGFGPSHARLLAEALTEHGRMRDIVAEDANPYGMKYVVQCNLTTPNERNPCIVSVWIVENGNAPRLVTAYPYSG